MSISLILIGIISLIVIGGTAYLYSNQNEELTEKKKTTILLIVGTVIFLSFLVTTFKHRDLGFRSSSEQQGTIDIQKVFYGDKCHYDFKSKYENIFDITRNNVQEMYNRNYKSLYDLSEKNEEQSSFLKDYQELIVYLSKKDQGASYFLNDLAKRICHDKSVPVVYLKLEEEMKKERQFLKKVGVFSFEQLQSNFCYFSKVDIKVNKYDVEYTSKYSEGHVFPYLIIDNFEHLLSVLAQHSYPFQQQMEDSENTYHSDQENLYRNSKYSGRRRLFDKILKELVGNCRVNLILNTEKEEAIEQLYDLWFQEGRVSRWSNGQEFPFEYRRWEGLKQYDLFKIISDHFPKSDFHLSKIVQENKQGKYSFKDLFFIMQEMKLRTDKSVQSKHQNAKESLFIKQWDIKYNLARYYGLHHQYKLIKANQNRKISSLKNRVSYGSFRLLEQLGLIEIRTGFVHLK